MSHDHHTGMDMGPMTTAVTSAAMAAQTSSSSMAGHNHGGGMSMGGDCKISMLWNWYTVDSCFLSRSWHVTSKGMFAGSCIGVILLVITLEFLRRAGKEYDRYIIAQHAKKNLSSSAAPGVVPASSASSADPDHAGNGKPGPTAANRGAACAPALLNQRFRPSILQQAVRALLHMLQFAVAYFVMLLAMYYNGYIIICIFIGAYLGYFIFGWESLNAGLGGRDRMQEEVTVCCG